MSLLISIFLAFIRVGTMTFGGAYAAIPLVEKEVVEVNAWMSYREFVNLLALDELTPGPIMINSATFVGMRIAGIPGAIAASLGCVLPGCLVSFRLMWVYRKYKEVKVLSDILLTLKCMAVALIASTFVNMVINTVFMEFTGFNTFMAVLGVISFIVLRKYKLNPIIVMVACGSINLIASLLIK